MTLWQKLKMLLTLNDAFNKLKEAKMKSSFTSSAFLLAALGIAGDVYCAVSGYIDPEMGLKIMGCMIAVYSVTNAIVKLTPTTKDDEFVAKLKAIIEKAGGTIPEK